MGMGNKVDILAIVEYSNKTEEDAFYILGFRNGSTMTADEVKSFKEKTWRAQIEKFLLLSSAILKDKTMVFAKQHDLKSNRLKKALNDGEVIPEFWLTAHVFWNVPIPDLPYNQPLTPLRPGDVADADLWLNGVRVTNIHPVGGDDDLFRFELITLSAERVRAETTYEYQWLARNL